MTQEQLKAAPSDDWLRRVKLVRRYSVAHLRWADAATNIPITHLNSGANETDVSFTQDAAESSYGSDATGTAQTRSGT